MTTKKYLHDLIAQMEAGSTEQGRDPMTWSKAWFPACRFRTVLLGSLDVMKSTQDRQLHMVSTSPNWVTTADRLHVWLSGNCVPEQLLPGGKCAGLLNDLRILAEDLGTAENRSSFKWYDPLTASRPACARDSSGEAPCVNEKDQMETASELPEPVEEVGDLERALKGLGPQG